MRLWTLWVLKDGGLWVEPWEKGRVGREVPFKSVKQQRETGGVRLMGDVVVKQQLIFFLL